MTTNGRWSLCCALLVLAACGDDSGTPPPVIPDAASVTIVSGDSVLSINDSGRYVAELRDANGDLIDDTPTWTVSNGTLASIDASGALSTTNAGVGTIYVIAEADGIRDSMELRVTQSWFAVSVGAQEICAYDTDRKMWCWGVSRGTTQPVDGLLPSRVETDAIFSRVEAGVGAGCGVVNGDGTAYCWGLHQFGYLGIGNISGSTPQPITGGFLFSDVELGWEHGCGRTTTQALVCWGRNTRGQIGDSVAGSGGVFGRAPTLVAGGRSWREVATGANRSCGIDNARRLYCWGAYDDGVSGWDSTITSDRNYPTVVDSANTYNSISLGEGHQCAARENGDLVCWGSNASGQLGNGTTSATVVRTPQPIPAGHGFQSVVVGADHTCALDADDRAWCWGGSALGHATITSSNVPVQVAGNRQFIALSAGEGMTCGLTLGSAIYCWGGGNLGDGTGQSSNTPVRVRDP